MNTPSNTSMNTPLSYHPSLVDLEEYAVAGEPHSAAAHVTVCASCSARVRQLRALHQSLADDHGQLPNGPAERLEARIQASLHDGVTVLLPHEPVDLEATGDTGESSPIEPGEPRAPKQRVRWFTRPAVLAAAVAAVAALSVFRPSKSAEAGMIAGTMTLSPSLPRPGEMVKVRYTAGALFGRPGVLRLRARLRTPHGESYNNDIPVVTLATLQRERGGEYTAQFMLPDSVVFAALAVEDTGATAVDDFGGRTWEVMRGTEAGTPTFAALDQRAHDLMGRGWEAGLATVRRMVALYPDTVAGWSWLSTYEIWMSLANDSTRAVHRAQAKRIGALYEQRGLLTASNLGRLYWYTHTLDSVSGAAWRTRLLREAPTDEFAVQERLSDIMSRAFANKDSLAALESLERLWPDTPRNRRDQVTDMALRLVPRRDEHAPVLERWIDRLEEKAPSIARERTAARIRLEVPSLREKGIAQLTSAATRSGSPEAFVRALDETDAAFRQRMLRAKSLTDAALGQALASVGRTSDALAVLRRAADASWDTEVFSALASASMAAGDTAFAMPYLGRVRVDPRTSRKRAATLDTLGGRVLGGQAWQSLLVAQRTEMSRRVLADASPRVVDDVTLRGIDGSERTLTQLAGGKPLMVVIWSPNCGPAVDALAEIDAMGRALAARGMPTVSIVEQSVRDTTLDITIAKSKFTLPVFLDPAGKATAAFNNWGTPQIYLVDGRRRVQFTPTSDVSLARLRAEAMLNARQ